MHVASAAVVAPVGPYLPAAHAVPVHADAPVCALNVPAAQFVHDDAPDALYVPAAHAVHDVASGLGLDQE